MNVNPSLTTTFDAMGIKVKASFGRSLEKAIKKDLEDIERNIINIMQYCGEQFVSDARNSLHISSSLFPKGDYKDRTANLRSSIGYFVMRDNEVVKEGSSNTHAREALASIPPKRGYRLIGVAGMDYASALESKGYNVITSQEEQCLVNLESSLREYTRKMAAMGITIDIDIDTSV